MGSRDLFALSFALFVIGLLGFGFAVDTYSHRDSEGYVHFKRRGTESATVAHFEFCFPTVFVLAGIGVGYWAWCLYQQGE